MKFINAFSTLSALAIAATGPVAVSAGIVSCPDPQPAIGDLCFFQGLDCDYGKETCCGKTYKAIRLQCDGSNHVVGMPLHHCQNPSCSASSHGDPHFKTWAGEQYDFHGGCDLVLVQNEGFSNGKGLRIHIRTQIQTWWSRIEAAVVSIGDNSLEVMGSTTGAHYWMNGGDMTEIVAGESKLGEFPVAFKVINDHQAAARIDLGNGDAISIETFKSFVRVNLANKAGGAFKGSSGLLGSFPNGEKVGRDGKTLIEDANEFGQEWQVLATEPSLFHSVEGVVQAPLKCAMPDETLKAEVKKRRLGQSVLTEEEAELACSRVNEVDQAACVFDVLATQDKDMAGSY